MRFSKAVAKYRTPILILTVLLMIPAVIGIANTRINYDMLNYLPEDMDITSLETIWQYRKIRLYYITIDKRLQCSWVSPTYLINQILIIFSASCP